MKVAALYDIHGNLPALKAVLEELDEMRVDQIVIGGDLILGPMSKECLDLLVDFSKSIQFILGNCEISVLEQKEGRLQQQFPESVLEDIKWTADQLDSKDQQVISNWPETIQLEIEGIGKVLFCHATPRNPFEIFTKQTSDQKLLPIFNSLDVDIVICGHTHMQFDRQIGNVRVINAGSVGMPFGKSGAHWLLIDEGFDFRQTTYDLNKAAAIIRQTSYPRAEGFAANNILNQPSEESMLELLSKGEIKE